MGTYAQGAQSSGSTPVASRDAGFSVLAQVATVQAAGAATADFVAYLPDGTQIVDVLLDTVTLHTSASATLAGGSTVGGTDLWPATNVLTAARARPTFTGAQLNAMQSMTHVSGATDVPVNMRLALGTPTSVGTTKVVILYAPKVS